VAIFPYLGMLTSSENLKGIFVKFEGELRFGMERAGLYCAVLSRA